MESIKAFFRKAYAAVAANMVSTVKAYPFTAGSLVLIGVAGTMLFQAFWPG